jgi:hypothetical protein
MISFYDFKDINLAAHDSQSGRAIKPVIRMPAINGSRPVGG